MNIDEKRSFITTIDLMRDSLESQATARDKYLREKGLPSWDTKLNRIYAAKAHMTKARQEIEEIQVEVDY